MNSSIAKYLVLTIRVVLTLAFLAAGIAKLMGAEMMVATFDSVGWGQWFRYVTGIIEIGGAILLWVPGVQILGALLLVCTMIGALFAHITVLGMGTAPPAIILGILSAVMIAVHRDQIRRFTGAAA
ncbi:DoxX family protein [Cucumibacter marinus]|uniref:DoxX family protein n=1 Tax=Cucumibacter marinus TaxID=1121252 RepID=UPI00041CB1E0|nr:DoxX family protein [Cucumibacter marinus]